MYPQKSSTVRVFKILSFLSLAFLLNGCLSPRDHYVAKQCNDSFSMRGMVNGEYESCATRASAKFQCLNYGFKEGTLDFSKCLMAVDVDRKIQENINSEVRRQVERDRFINGKN
jgi:hypothetical protein